MAAIIQGQASLGSGVCDLVVTRVSHITLVYRIDICSVLNTDMKNFKKSLVCSPFSSCSHLISFHSFVVKIPIRKTSLLHSPLRHLQPLPPPLRCPSNPPRLFKGPSQTALDTMGAIIPFHPSHLRSLLARLFNLLPPRTVD